MLCCHVAFKTVIIISNNICHYTLELIHQLLFPILIVDVLMCCTVEIVEWLWKFP